MLPETITGSTKVNPLGAIRLLRSVGGLISQAVLHHSEYYGDERGSMWKGLGEMLNTIAEEPNKLAVIQSACATFQTFDTWLQHE